MLLLDLRRLIALALVASCASGTYLDDAGVRRSALEASLVNKSNGYARLRLEHYGKDWESLPVFNPRTAGVRTTPSDFESPIATEGRDLRAIGEEAFFRYPVQAAPAAEMAIGSIAAANAYGFWTDDRIGGLVRVEGKGLAYTCSTCHAKIVGGALAIGVPNANLDLGGLMVDAGFVFGDRKANLLAWGPGRLDVTTNEGTEPVKIPDLRPVRFETHLHATASVLQADETALAVRIETLIITSNDGAIRPPREIALGLARYLRSLADDLPAPTTNATFEANCARCHAPPAFTGPPVAIGVVGTDPRVGMSAERGTGNYRVPSLRGVGTRGPLLHDASVPSLEKMLDPSRTNGHPFGLGLGDDARADLIAYLRTL